MTSPICCAAIAIAAISTRGSDATAAQSAAHHASGSCSLRGGTVGGWGARPVATSRPSSASRSSTFVDWVDESTPSTSGTVYRTSSRFAKNVASSS